MSLELQRLIGRAPEGALPISYQTDAVLGYSGLSV
jgi:hypothetical protein